MALESIMDTILVPLHDSWTERNLGLLVEDISLTHMVWTDNIYIISGSIDGFTTMMNELTAEIENWKLLWKNPSLEVI